MVVDRLEPGVGRLGCRSRHAFFDPRIGEKALSRIERGRVAQAKLVYEHAAVWVENPLERGALGRLSVAH